MNILQKNYFFNNCQFCLCIPQIYEKINDAEDLTLDTLSNWKAFSCKGKSSFIKYKILCKNLSEDVLKFETQFTEIFAAGGIVFSKKDEVLAIKRLGYWDLPKGKIEKGEIPLQAAKREIAEETGLTNELKLKRKLIETQHIYFANDQYYLKTTYWFEFEIDTQGGKANRLIPQIEEQITEVEWIPKNEFKNTFLPNTYTSILSLVENEYPNYFI